MCAAVKKSNSAPVQIPTLEKLREMRETALENTDGDKLIRKYDKACDMIFKAYEARTWKTRISRTIKCLEVSPFCTDAYNILGNHDNDPEKAFQYFEAGAQSALMIYGEEYFRELEGEFWLFLETRPYMRSLNGMMECRRRQGKIDEAIKLCELMLKLCPNDNLGVRDRLIVLLIGAKDYKKAEELYKKYEDDCSANWEYARALLDYAGNRAAAKTGKNLQLALKDNPYFPAYLLGEKELPQSMPPLYSYGSEEEAILFAADQIPLWRGIDGACEWLAEKMKEFDSNKKSA